MIEYKPRKKHMFKTRQQANSSVQGLNTISNLTLEFAYSTEFPYMKYMRPSILLHIVPTILAISLSKLMVCVLLTQRATRASNQ